MDHLTMESVRQFQTAVSPSSTIEQKKDAIEALMKGPLPREARDQLRIILTEICPLEAIEYRKDVAA